MDDNEWMNRLNRRPIHWWLDLMRNDQDFTGMITTDPTLVEYNYTRSFHPAHLEQWIRVFQTDEAIDLFDRYTYYDNACPFECNRYIWHNDALHRIETHHESHSVFRPIRGELPFHFIFQAIPSLADGEYYFIHLYGRRADLHYVWAAVNALFRLDYNNANFQSLGLEAFLYANENNRWKIPWVMDYDNMRSWLETRQGGDHRVHLSGFYFERESTLEIIRAACRGTVFHFTGCMFDGGTVFQDGHIVFSRGYLAVVLANFQAHPQLLYVLIRTNGNIVDNTAADNANVSI
jgi:hypothetical protein